jgi:tRNA(Ile2)-agmatinylcytidine synthase
VGWLGLDDTDHLGGGCTTWTMHQLLSSLPPEVSVVGDPCLVRLYPMAKARTRGNAALAVELDVRLDATTWHLWLEQYWEAHLATLAGLWTPSTHAARTQVPSDPGLVWFESKPPPSFYRMAVAEEVAVDAAPEATWSAGGQGIIGATAAVAWPLSVSTWEGIAWRQRHDRARQLDEGVMERLDHDPGLVACRDPRKGRSLLAPRGTSPVLFGLRGTNRSAVEQGVRDLVEAKGTEDVAGMRIFQTNQGSGDHLPPALEATVDKVHILRGGHVALDTSEGTWLAFAPSDELRHLAAQLVTGDVVQGLGLVSDEEGREGLHLEALNHVAGPLRDTSRPLCPTCGIRMKSAGRHQGLRCPSCPHREPDRWIGTPVTPSGWVQPPLDRRRHLAPELGVR